MTDKKRFGIVVSGGPAPGINCVISSVVIEAVNSGFEVVGFMNGFRGLCNNPEESFRELTIDLVTGSTSSGGSILGTSRFNPFESEESQAALFSTLAAHRIDKLIVIGGEGSAYLGKRISDEDAGVQVVHVPKTIDNDIILPNNYPSFGFTTACSVGTRIIDTYMVDARTEQKRWFIVTSMGRSAGFLALGLGIRSGATLTLIPEEFDKRDATPEKVASMIFESVIRRYKQGKPYGVAILAEGILDRLDPDSHESIKGCPRDELGRIRHNELEIGEVVAPILREMAKARDIPVRFSAENIGYELRCHAPGSFDIEYTKFLGVGAVKYLLEGRTGITVIRDHDNFGFINLSSMADESGRIKSRSVNLKSDLYEVARSFMIR